MVVLPFTNIGGDPEQEHFVDGVAESLAIDLSRISDGGYRRRPQPSLPSARSACYPMRAMNIAGGDRFGCWVIVKGDATGKSSPSVFARDLTAIEMPRGIRISAVSPTIVEESMKDFGPFFRGHDPVPALRVGRAFSRSSEGLETGNTYRVV